MDNNTPQKNNDGLSRRQALKTIAAVTGAATLTQLPSKWASPTLKSGVLPAHAQTTPPNGILTISDLQAIVLLRPNSEGFTIPLECSVDYEDTAGAVGAGSEISVQLSSNPAGILPTDTLITAFANDGDGGVGTLIFTIEVDLTLLKGIPDSITVTVQVTDTLNIISNILEETFMDIIPQ